jgi:hypothetical protein
MRSPVDVSRPPLKQGLCVRAGRGQLPDDRGAVATEFVILIPIFLTLIFGMVWAGTTFLRYTNLELAAREGARYGATLPTGFPTDADTSGTPASTWFEAIADQVAGASIAPTRICVAYSGLLGSEDANNSGATTSVRYIRESDGSASSGGGTCFIDGHGVQSRRVQVETEGLVPFRGFGFFEGTLRGTATARFEAPYPTD